MNHDLLALLGAACTTGALGSLHCVAMCGPLAVAGCSRQGRAQLVPTLGYFTGRLVSYALAGALFGLLGQHAHHLLPFEPVQRIALGGVILYALVRGVRLLRGPAPPRERVVPLAPPSQPPADRAPGALALLATAFPRRGLALGLATGILPCGLLATGWALAAASARPWAGSAVMVLFAVASAPGLLLPLVGQRLLRRLSAGVSPTLQGVGWLLLAAWVLARPLLHGGHAGH